MFNTINKTWKKFARMNEFRDNASCVVFEGRIVVSGGFNNIDGRLKTVLNTVEAYDHVDDSLTNMPNMIERRSSHKSVAIKNKLFIISGYNSHTLEVFDSSSKNFTLMQLPSTNLDSYYIADVTLIGNKVVLFSNLNRSVFLYDVANDAWSEKSCKATKHIQYFSCASLPQ